MPDGLATYKTFRPDKSVSGRSYTGKGRSVEEREVRDATTDVQYKCTRGLYGRVGDNEEIVVGRYF